MAEIIQDNWRWLYSGGNPYSSASLHVRFNLLRKKNIGEVFCWEFCTNIN